VLVYDYLLTIEREARLVWPVPWNIGKVLYFLTRYPVFADTFMVLYHQFAILDPATCDALYKTIGFLLGVGTLIAESILAVRTWVIWHRDRRVAIGLCAALILFWIPVFYFLQVALYSLVFTTPPSPNLPGCFLLKQKNILFAVFVLVMVFETLILALTLLKGLEHFRGTNSTLISVLYRDGIMNYIYLCVLSIVNVVVLLTAPHGYSTLLTALQRALHSILSARILLHLREAAIIRAKTSVGPGAYLTSSLGGFTVDRARATGPDFAFEPSAFSTGGVTATTATGYTDDLVTPTFDDKEADAEIWFGERAEGALPETVTWFGDERDSREDVQLP